MMPSTTGTRVFGSTPYARKTKDDALVLSVSCISTIASMLEAMSMWAFLHFWNAVQIFLSRSILSGSFSSCATLRIRLISDALKRTTKTPVAAVMS